MTSHLHLDPAAEPRASLPPSAYPADLYAAVHRGNEGDRRYYRLVAAGARDVLELGCGFGRIASALSLDGVDVVGLDLDPEMVELARRAAPRATLEVGDMRRFALSRRFDRVLIPYNGLYCLLTREDVVQTLRLAAEHLRKDGLVVFDGYNADPFHRASTDDDGDWDEESFVKTVRARGTRWDVFERSRWDRSTQRIDAVYRHRPRDEGHAPVVASIPQRYLLGAQIEGLLADAGLELLALQGGFDQQAYETLESPSLVVVARRL